MSIEFDDHEVRALERRLASAGSQAERSVRRVVAKTGHDTVAGAQRIVPVDTGHLKSTISVDIDADGLGFEAGPHASYGHYVEFGTSRMAPQPYLLPAFDRQTEIAMRALEEIAGNIL